MKHSKINLVEGEKFISCDNPAAKKCSEYFINIPILNMPSHRYKYPDSLDQDPILKIIDTYRNDPSIKLAKVKNDCHIFKVSQVKIDKGKSCIKISTRKKPRFILQFMLFMKKKNQSFHHQSLNGLITTL